MKKLLTEALKARSHAYAPYSKFQVGAALVDDQGRVFVGCNVENSSYGATTCAERNAIAAMVSQGGHKFTEILIATDTPKGCPPCGICRQVLVEFAQDAKRVQVHLANTKGVVKTFGLSELLPEAFDSAFF